MADLRVLSPDEIAAHLRPGWKVDGDAIERDYVFPSFVTAFGFMASSALVAERMNHHPEWSNVYGTVKVRLSTHSLGGVTQNDIALAAAMDGIAEHQKPVPG
jgi:4a-hydroxytetrahydrobiopterin dehydratase